MICLKLKIIQTYRKRSNYQYHGNLKHTIKEILLKQLFVITKHGLHLNVRLILFSHLDNFYLRKVSDQTQKHRNWFLHIKAQLNSCLGFHLTKGYLLQLVTPYFSLSFWTNIVYDIPFWAYKLAHPTGWLHFKNIKNSSIIITVWLAK